MGIVHFLDVGHGDCSIIEHATGRVTVIDVCKARAPERAKRVSPPTPTVGVLAALAARTNSAKSMNALAALFEGAHSAKSVNALASLFEQAHSAPPRRGARSLPGGGGLWGKTDISLGEVAGSAPPPRRATLPSGGRRGLSPGMSLAEAITPTTPQPRGLGFGLAEALTATPRPTGLLALAEDEETGPVNPIEYLRDRGISKVFRFILTHPEMDHMDGIKDSFEEFTPTNFWDTANTCEKTFGLLGAFLERDWDFYKGLRDGTALGSITRLVLYAGERGRFFNEANVGELQDGLYVLSPTRQLITEARRTGKYNDASYVVLYRSRAGSVLFCGDSHDKTWEHILANHLDEVRGVDLMLAPHHGRDSDRDRAFLSEVRPKLTLFGDAPSEHLCYDAWRNRGLRYLTCKQAGTVIVDTNDSLMKVYVKKEACARKNNEHTFYSSDHGGWFWGFL